MTILKENTWIVNEIDFDSIEEDDSVPYLSYLRETGSDDEDLLADRLYVTRIDGEIVVTDDLDSYSHIDWKPAMKKHFVEMNAQLEDYLQYSIPKNLK